MSSFYLSDCLPIYVLDIFPYIPVLCLSLAHSVFLTDFLSILYLFFFMCVCLYFVSFPTHIVKFPIFYSFFLPLFSRAHRALLPNSNLFFEGQTSLLTERENENEGQLSNKMLDRIKNGNFLRKKYLMKSSSLQNAHLEPIRLEKNANEKDKKDNFG